MAFSGKLLHRIDARLMMIAGTGFFFVSMTMLSHVTSAAGTGDFFWPLIWRGLGLGLMFVPLTNITLATLAPREIGAGAALSNFFRQLGGSLGIAVMATLLTHYTDLAHSMLLEHIGAYDPNSLQRVAMITQGFIARGNDPAAAHAMALRAIDGMALGQANVIGFSKVYQLSGWVLLGTIPLLAFVRQTKPAARIEISE
jgi:DHA2 family multidrug resistance protein